MTISVTEKFGSGQSSEGESRSVDLLYTIYNPDGEITDIEAKEALANTAPVLYDGLKRHSWSVEPLGPGLWDGSVRYAKKDNEEGDSSFSFDTGGGTQHVTQSLQTVGSYAPSGQQAPNCHGAIGVTHDSVEGVDVTVPIYNFAETHYLDPAMVTGAYKAALFALTGKVNSSAFRGFAAGEVLFLGASGSQRGEEDWEITFRFAASPNITGLEIGPISGVDKRGWEYLWVRYADSEDTDAKALVKKPVAVYVEQVYPTASFAGLGI